MGLAPGVADIYLLDQTGGLCHLLVEEGVYFFHRLVAPIESIALDLRIAEVATAVLVYLHTEAARRQAIVKVAIADYGEIASCCGHFFGVEFLGQPVALGAVAEVDAHYQRVVLLGYWILAASCLGVDWILRNNLQFAASDTQVLGASRQSDTQSDTGQSDCRDYAEGAKDGPRSRR